MGTSLCAEKLDVQIAGLVAGPEALHLQTRAVGKADEAAAVIVRGELAVILRGWRRAFAKKDEEKIFEFMVLVGDHPKKEEIFLALRELSHFGLCRAHAINLGRLIWALAYQKAHNPEQFWRAALKHCQGS